MKLFTVLPLLLLLLLVGTATSAREKASGKLVVKVTGFRNTTGNLGAALFQNPKAFPRNIKQAVGQAGAKISGGSATVAFSDLPPGTYALVVIHDENSNNDLDKNFMGIPTEGYGFSNNALPKRLSPPSFEAAKFQVEQSTKTIDIQLLY